MFDNQRYMTRGIESSIPYETILLLWQLLDVRKKESEMDYLQVFLLTVQGTLQHIEHSQEDPPYTARFAVKMDAEPVNAKIFVIDDESHSTILLAEEY